MTVSWLAGLGVKAGEAIQFTPGKSKVASDLENPLSKERASAIVRRPGMGGGVESVESALMANQRQGPQRTRREEKKAKNADIEKKNWIILDHGELQQKDEEGSELGLRNDSIEKERTVGEIWFTPSRDDRVKGPASLSRVNSARTGTGTHASGPNGNASARSAPEDRPSEEAAGPAIAKEPQSQQVTASLKDPEARSPLTSTDQKEGALRDLFRSTPPAADGRNDDLGARPSSASGGAQSGTLRNFGLGRDLAAPSQPSAGPSPLLDTSRRGLLSGPSIADGPGLSSGARGLGAGSSFGSSFQSPFSSPSVNPYNQRPDYNSRLDLAPGSSRNTFERH